MATNLFESILDRLLATVQIPVEAKDGSRWPPFEYRTRLYLNDQIGFRKSGDHFTGHFSSIRLFTRTLHAATPSRAAITAVHEMLHMMFAMLRRFEQQFGTDTAARLLSRQPWRLLVLNGFTAHRERLERHMRDLLHVLPIPMQAADLAASLVEEAFARMFGVIVDETIALWSRKRGADVPPTFGFLPEDFIAHYILERGFNVTKDQLKARGAGQTFLRMASDVNALATALRAHLDS